MADKETMVEHFTKLLAEKHSMNYAIVMALNFKISTSNIKTHGAIQQLLEECRVEILEEAKKHRSVQDRTLLSHISLIRFYTRFAGLVNPSASIDEIIKEICWRGLKLAKNIQNQSATIRKFAVPHFRGNKVRFNRVDLLTCRKS